MDESRQKLPVTLTRDQLYALVWATPMFRLAPLYGLTGNGLKKICKRLKIPVPPPGYWAKKAAGKRVAQYRLADPDADTPGDVTIRPARAPRAKIVRKLEQVPEDQRPTSELLKKIGAIEVPQRLARPHPIVAGWLAERERDRERARSEPDLHMRRLWMPKPWTEVERRVHRILDTLFKAVERQGFAVKIGDKRHPFFEIGGEQVLYRLRERQRQVQRLKNEDEMKWHRAGDPLQKKELQPTGILVLTIDTPLRDGLRREWKDRPEASLEDQLAEVAAALVDAEPMLVERRRKREEEERQRRENERRRWEEADFRKLDGNRWRRFRELAERWQEAELTLRFIDALEARGPVLGCPHGDKSLEESIEWARAWVRVHDPLNVGTDGVFRDVSSVTSWIYSSTIRLGCY